MITNSKINTIRNINLIYVYSTDSIFNKESNKYVGIKLVYNNSSILEVDYKDPLFGELIKKVLERYNKEKESRNIVLLGDFTKKLINEASFYVLNGIEEKNNQLKYYSYENKLLNKYKPYLFENINLIFKEILKCESFNIANLIGYNKTYKLDYSINGSGKSTKAMIYEKDNVLYFKIGSIGNTNNYIKGSIEETNGKIIVKSTFDRYVSNTLYDPLNNEVIKNIYFGKKLYYANNNTDTLLQEDKRKVSNYLNLLGIESSNKILKINDDTFLCFYSNNVVKNGELLYKEDLIFINLEEDTIRIINSSKEGFSKYDGIITVLLDKKENSITIRKLFDRNKNILIKEKNIEGDYSYSLMITKEDKNLKEELDISGFEDTLVDSIEDIKKYKKEVIR